jgi:hypothetical protein
MQKMQKNNFFVPSKLRFSYEEGFVLSALTAKMAESQSKSLTSLANLEDKIFIGYAVPPDASISLC